MEITSGNQTSKSINQYTGITPTTRLGDPKMTRNQAIATAKKAAKRHKQVYFVIINETGYDIATEEDLETFYYGYRDPDIIYCTEE